MDYSRPRVDGIRAQNIEEGDQLLDVRMTDGNVDIILASSAGYAVRFEEHRVRPMGRTATGVRGISLAEGEAVVGMIAVTDPNMMILTVSAHGYGKRSPVEEYRLTNRGGKGVTALKATERTGPLVAVRGVTDEDDLVIATINGLLIRISASTIRETGRTAGGVKLLTLKEGDAIADVSRVVKEEEENGLGGDGALAEENGSEPSDGASEVV